MPISFTQASTTVRNAISLQNSFLSLIQRKFDLVLKSIAHGTVETGDNALSLSLPPIHNLNY